MKEIDSIIAKMAPHDADTLLRVMLTFAHPDSYPEIRQKLSKLNADHPGSADPERAAKLLREEGPGILNWIIEGVK